MIVNLGTAPTRIQFVNPGDLIFNEGLAPAYVDTIIGNVIQAPVSSAVPVAPGSTVQWAGLPGMLYGRDPTGSAPGVGVTSQSGLPFPAPIVSGQNLVIPGIQSPNFLTGVSGWRINRDGSAEFNNLEIRGTFMGNEYLLNANGAFFYAPTEGIGNLFLAITTGPVSDPSGNVVTGGGLNIGTWDNTGTQTNHFGVDTFGNLYLFDSQGNTDFFADCAGFMEWFTDSANANALMTIAKVASVDTFGNAIPIGFNMGEWISGVLKQCFSIDPTGHAFSQDSTLTFFLQHYPEFAAWGAYDTGLPGSNLQAMFSAVAGSDLAYLGQPNNWITGYNGPSVAWNPTSYAAGTSTPETRHTLGLTNAWAGSGNGVNGFFYQLLPDGTVYLEWDIKSPNAAPGTIGQLPVGYRPSVSHNVQSGWYGTGPAAYSNTFYPHMLIDTTGLITPESVPLATINLHGSAILHL